MDMNHTRPAQQFFIVGWFKFPNDLDANYDVIEIVHLVLICLAFVSNPLLLGVIIKNPSGQRRTRSTMLLVNICVASIIVSSFGLVYFISRFQQGSDVFDYKTDVIVMSIALPMYYSCFFLLTLSHFAMIVKPLKFKTLEMKKIRIVVFVSIMLWLWISIVFIITPSLVSDFDEYLKIMVTVLVSLCWLVTIIVVILNIRILITLRRRNIAMGTTFNMTDSRQRFIITKQNTRLAKVLFVFMTVKVLTTLPLFTSYLIILHCPMCYYPVNHRFALYMTPCFMSVQAFNGFYWLVAIPPYYKEVKRLARKILCRRPNSI